MFNSKDLSLLNMSYFEVVTSSPCFYELISKNGDYWMIMQVSETLTRLQRAKGLEGEITYKLFHRHEYEDAYHLHAESFYVQDLVLEIIQHDDYKLHTKNPLFDKVARM